MKQQKPDQRWVRQKSNGPETTNAALFRRGRGFLKGEMYSKPQETSRSGISHPGQLPPRAVGRGHSRKRRRDYQFRAAPSTDCRKRDSDQLQPRRRGDGSRERSARTRIAGFYLVLKTLAIVLAAPVEPSSEISIRYGTNGARRRNIVFERRHGAARSS